VEMGPEFVSVLSGRYAGVVSVSARKDERNSCASEWVRRVEVWVREGG
jgi:hypothetical protein